MAHIAVLSSGFMVGGAFAAFYSALSLFSKIYYIVNLEKGIKALAICLVVGIFFGSIISLYDISIELTWAANLFLLFGGMFIGIYIALLAEVLKIIPVMSSFGFVKSFIFIAVLAVAIGKAVGSLVYFIFPYFR